MVQVSVCYIVSLYPDWSSFRLSFMLTESILLIRMFQNMAWFWPRWLWTDKSNWACDRWLQSFWSSMWINIGVAQQRSSTRPKWLRKPKHKSGECCHKDSRNPSARSVQFFLFSFFVCLSVNIILLLSLSVVEGKLMKERKKEMQKKFCNPFVHFLH